jgi:two-component system, NtrC family, sensor kinase
MTQSHPLTAINVPAAPPLNAGTSTHPRRDLDRILIVDDSPTQRHIFSKQLSHRYICDQAGSYDEAVKLFKQRDFAVVLTDIIMPGLSGIELLRKILEIDKDTAVVMVSGVDRLQRVLDALRLGAFDYIFKPCEPDVLEMTVERAIEKRGLMMKAYRYEADLESRNRELARQKAELERLQTQLVNHEKMASLGQLAAGVAHELNNPAGFIYGNMDLLNGTLEGLAALMKDATGVDRQAVDAAFSEAAAIVGDCLEGAERIRGIVDNLRTFSRLDEAEFKETDVNEGLHSTTRLLSRYFGNSDVALVEDYGEVPPIEAFAGQLNQVWMNLLANAAQAVDRPGGEVRICTRMVDGDAVAVSVSDNGTGIAPEHLDRIFDPFFTTKPVGEGTGLGLAISFGIVARHNGTITVNSAPGEGSTFIVTLPTRIVNAIEPAEVPLPH